MANPKLVGSLRRGLAAFATWREENPKESLDLRDADLRDTNLFFANLRGADLHSADLLRTNLRSTVLRSADLSSANLRYADLRHADLSSADLSSAVLSYADLRGSHINKDTKFDGVIVNSETKGLGPWVFNPEKYIIREIEFPPEYRQAGIGIMNYFAEVMRQKYPDIPATVQITQDDLTVRMTIETDDGYRETVEKTLAEYSLVISGKQQPEEMLSDPVHVIRLENQLTHVRAQLETERRVLQLTEQQNRDLHNRTTSLEEDVRRLQDVIHDALRHSQRQTTRLINTSSKHTSEFTQLFRDLLDRPDASAAAVQDALATIQQTLEAIDERQEVAEAERTALIESVRTLHDQSPTVLRQLTEAVPNIGSGIVANIISGVLQMYGWMPGG